MLDTPLPNDALAMRVRDVPVVFLHGWAGSAHGTWLASGIPARLRALGRECIVPDLPGHGIAALDRPASHGPTDYDDIVEQVNAALPDGPMDLVGYSLGAKIALCIAAKTPHRVRRLAAVAVGDNIFSAEASGPLLGDILARGIAVNAPERLRRMAVYAFQSGADPMALAACLRRRWIPPSEAALRTILAPVLLVLAEQDELVKSSERLRASLGAVTTRELRGQDHLSAPYATELADLVIPFLSVARDAQDERDVMAEGARG